MNCHVLTPEQYDLLFGVARHSDEKPQYQFRYRPLDNFRWKGTVYFHADDVGLRGVYADPSEFLERINSGWSDDDLRRDAEKWRLSLKEGKVLLTADGYAKLKERADKWDEFSKFYVVGDVKEFLTRYHRIFQERDHLRGENAKLKARAEATERELAGRKKTGERLRKYAGLLNHIAGITSGRAPHGPAVGEVYEQLPDAIHQLKKDAEAWRKVVASVNSAPFRPRDSNDDAKIGL